ncbi:tRNA (adenosine(37)-N6)-threonylcarbamoyltransferase complex ATPase subunit type 1 TsaE [bacterium]|nr:tRNA (adenosine(37)-N6)-threonylcarbamoyltransferase complex ATPase subunit type 1 TsaE [bacterium]
MIVFTATPEETIEIGKRFAEKLKKGDIVGFVGELGSGKTTMIKGIVKNFSEYEATSPSFVLINEYPGKTPVFHFDLYRIENIKEMETLGWEEYLDKGIVLIEWADKILEELPENTILVKISVEKNGKRKIEITKNKGGKNDKSRKNFESIKS